MATALTGTIVDGSSRFAVSINSTDGTAIDPSRPTWLIIHGWNSNPAEFSDLVAAIRSQRPSDQILTLDWSTAAGTGNLNPFDAEKRIPLVATWAAAALIDTGFSGTSLNEIGHSFGSYVAGEIAELIPGGVNTIVALDPAVDVPGNYNPDGAGGVQFAQYSQYAWAFHDSDPADLGNLDGLGSPNTPVTADEAFDVADSSHTAIPDLFTYLVSHPGDAVGQYFTLDRLLDHQSGPWQLNQYNANGVQVSGAGYEGVITATGGGVRPQSIAYVVAPASVSIDDVTITEGDAGSQVMTFTVTRTGGSSAFDIGYATLDGTATSVGDHDFNALAGSLHFDAGENTKTISVSILGDTKREANETFTVTLSNPTSGVAISDGQGIGTILNDDVNHAPTVSLPSGAVVTASSPGQSIQFSSLFAGSDADQDTLVYYLYDSTASAASGHWVVNGTTVAAQTIYQVTAAQLAQTAFVAGTAGTFDDLYVQAYDGIAYSGWNATARINVPDAVNHAPVVTAPQANVAATPSQSLALSTLFSASDSDGDTLSYFLYDSNASASSGHFVVNGAALPAQTIQALTAAQFAQATYVAGDIGTSESIYVQSSDGKLYSGWNTSVNVAVTSPNHAPTVNLIAGANVTKTSGQSVAVSSLFSASDSDGDTLTYFLYDTNAGANSGHLEVNGVTVAAQTITAVTAAQLAQTTFIAGADGISDGIYLQAFDGKAYSGWNAGVTIKSVAPNDAPTVSLPLGSSVAASAGQTLQLSDLFAGSDANGDPLSYFVYDTNDAAGSGHVEIGGQVVAAKTITAMSAAQLAQAVFIAGGAGTADDIFVQAFDGKAYSGWNAGVHILV